MCFVVLRFLSDASVLCINYRQKPV